MKKLIKIIFSKIQNRWAGLENKYLYNSGAISKIEYRLRKDFLKEVEQFGTMDFYQNYPPLKISGRRNTLCRFNVYRMKDRLGEDMEVLDIGGNIGFFSLYISKFVSAIDLIEQNKNLTDIGKKLADHEKITNVNIINLDFKKYSPEKRYDMIMSLAIHKWVGLEFDEYLKRIHILLKKGGLLLMESHIIYNNKGDHIEALLNESPLFDIIEKGEIDDHDGKYREFFWLRAK
jgi:SAM-dependent methyltransferase